MVDENFRAFRETTPNDGFYGREKVQNDTKERIRDQRERAERKKNNLVQPFVFIFANFCLNDKKKKKIIIITEKNTVAGAGSCKCQSAWSLDIKR